MGCQEKKAEVGWVPVSYEFVRAQALAPTQSEPPLFLRPSAPPRKLSAQPEGC